MRKEESRVVKASSESEHGTIGRADGKSGVGVLYGVTNVIYLAELPDVSAQGCQAHHAIPRHITLLDYKISIKHCSPRIQVGHPQAFHYGPSQQLDAREHDGRKFSASRCRK